MVFLGQFLSERLHPGLLIYLLFLIQVILLSLAAFTTRLGRGTTHL